MVSWLVICIIRKIPHIMVWVYFWNIWFFELVFKIVSYLFVLDRTVGLKRRKIQQAAIWIGYSFEIFDKLRTLFAEKEKMFAWSRIFPLTSYLHEISSLLVFIRLLKRKPDLGCSVFVFTIRLQYWWYFEFNYTFHDRYYKVG